MDQFEKYLAGQTTEPKNEKRTRNNIHRTAMNSSEPVESTSEAERPMRHLGGRRGIPPGTLVNHVRVVGQDIKKGDLALFSQRDYRVECIAKTGDKGGACGKRFVATYHQIYYRTLFSCGCLKRLRHPPIQLEDDQVGVLRVLRWDELQGWECVCQECGEVMYARRIDEVRALGMKCPPHRKREAGA